MQGTFCIRSFEVSLESCGALCKISNVKIFKRILLGSCMVIWGKQTVTVLAIRQTLKILWHFDIFNTGPYGA